MSKFNQRKARVKLLCIKAKARKEMLKRIYATLKDTECTVKQMHLRALACCTMCGHENTDIIQTYAQKKTTSQLLRVINDTTTPYRQLYTFKGAYYIQIRNKLAHIKQNDIKHTYISSTGLEELD